MDADLTIARLAATQHGVAARQQLLPAGVPGHVVRHRLGTGLLVPVHAGVYRLAGSPLTWPARIMAATLAAGPGAAASHRAAAFVHGLAGVEPWAEVTVPVNRAPRVPGVVVHRATGLTASDREVRVGIPCTRPPATIIGLASVVPPRVLEAALDDALVRGLVRCRQLERRVALLGRHGRKGTLVLSALLAARGGRRWTQSEFERRLLRLLQRAGLPPVVPQHEIRLPGGGRAFVDFAWPEIRVGVEANSYRHHASHGDWSRDNTRNNLLIALGWRILPVTWDDMVHRPQELVDLLRRARAA